MNVPPSPTVKLVPPGRAVAGRDGQRAGVNGRAAGVGVPAAEDQSTGVDCQTPWAKQRPSQDLCAAAAHYQADRAQVPPP